MSEPTEATPLLKASNPATSSGAIGLQRTASSASLHPAEPVIHLNSPMLVAHQPESPTKARIHPIAVVIPLFFSVLAITFCIVPIQQWLLLYVCRGEMEKGIFNGVFGWEGCRQDTHVQVYFRTQVAALNFRAMVSGRENLKEEKIEHDGPLGNDF
jgi:hypothetical protein